MKAKTPRTKTPASPGVQQIFKDFGAFIEFLATDQPFNEAQWETVRHPFLASLARLARLDVPKIASERLIAILKAA